MTIDAPLKPGDLWTDDLIKQKVASDLAEYRQATGGAQWPIKPDALALNLWNIKTIHVSGDLLDPAGSPVWAYFNPNERTIYAGKNANAGMLAFSLAHEVGHVSLHDFLNSSRYRKEVWCRELDDGDVLEIQANKYASLLLMPRDVVREEIQRITAGGSLDMDIHAAPLMAHFGVSFQALDYCLSSMGVTRRGAKYGGRSDIDRMLDEADMERQAI